MYFGTFTNKYFKKIIEDACACEKALQMDDGKTVVRSRITLHPSHSLHYSLTMQSRDIIYVIDLW